MFEKTCGRVELEEREPRGQPGRGARSGRRPIGWLAFALGSWILGGGLMVACSPGSPGSRPAGAIDAELSAPRVRAHAEWLGERVPRLPGSRADRRARRYLRSQLERAGLEVRELEAPEGRHLVGRLPGRTRDRILLVAPYPTLASLDHVDDTGAALLLELARVLASEGEPPYELLFAFSETRPPRTGADGEARPAVGSRQAAQARLRASGRSLARALEPRDGIARLRAGVVLRSLGAPDLRVARDLRSHAAFREIFWETAARLGLEETFPGQGAWTSVEGLRIGFVERSGFDRMVALTDQAVSRPDLAGPFRRAVERSDEPGLQREETPALSTDSLGRVGRVALESIRRIILRLARVDAFGLEVPGASAAPDASRVPETSDRPDFLPADPLRSSPFTESPRNFAMYLFFQGVLVAKPRRSS